ncbi:MAG: InlB B-repeat-containing protein [Lachnospiraceae bacterium]|nr:InlB B-repeat-containing protein [Lachnospiraceae bacterium]
MPKAEEREYWKGKKFTFTKNTTLYAFWQKANSFPLVYDLNGGYKANVQNQSVPEGSYATIPDAKALRCGYYFLGWSESKTATEATYRKGDRIKATKKTTLYAVWKVDKTGKAGHLFESKYGPTEVNENCHREDCKQCGKNIDLPHTLQVVALVDNSKYNNNGYHVKLCVDDRGMKCGYGEMEHCSYHVDKWDYYMATAGEVDIYIRTGICNVCKTKVSEMAIMEKQKRITLDDFIEDTGLFDVLVGGGILKDIVDGIEDIHDDWDKYTYQKSLDPENMEKSLLTGKGENGLLYLNAAKGKFKNTAKDPEVLYYYYYIPAGAKTDDYWNHSMRPLME